MNGLSLKSSNIREPENRALIELSQKTQQYTYKTTKGYEQD